MSWIWILPALLVIALVGVFYPLFTRRGATPLPSGLEGDPRTELTARRDVLLMQLKELELENSTDDATLTARQALEQELAGILTRLDASPAHPTPDATTTDSAMPKKNPMDIAIGISTMLAITVISGLLYLFMGTPRDVPPQQAGATNSPHAPNPQEIVAMVEQAAQRLRSAPDDIQGWMRLARSYQVLNRPNEAIQAYLHILSRQPDLPDATISLCELLLQSPDATRQKEGSQRLEQLLTNHPDHPEALWLLSADAMRNGDNARASALLNRLKPLLPPGSEAAATVEQALSRITPP